LARTCFAKKPHKISPKLKMILRKIQIGTGLERKIIKKSHGRRRARKTSFGVHLYPKLSVISYLFWVPCTYQIFVGLSAFYDFFVYIFFIQTLARFLCQ